MIASKVKFAASFYAIMSISFWGISFVSTKAVLDKLDPYTLLVLRFGIGALFLLVLLVLKRYPLNIPLKYIPHLIVLGILGVFIHQVIQATALLTINASAAGWIISFSPVFTVILSVFFLHEKMTLLKASGIIVAIIGVLLVTTSSNQHSLQLPVNIGYLLMILSTLNWAIYSVLLKKLDIQLPSLVVTFYMCLIGFTLTTPFLVRNKGWEIMPFLTSVEWAHLLFLGVFVSGVAYWYWAKALEVLEASQVSVFLYLEPVATLITAVLLLREKIIPVSILGGVIIIVGVIVANGRLLTFLRYLPWRNKKL
ncbi:DMT family transporter [Priestia aryabhattai]|uniref:Putative amino-acid metabolite efflux pump n=2 Tax=Priestia TaxID=2800373 RepID=A0A806U405_PRIMG|nr:MULTISPECIES: DMT family transporter [Priestia]AKP76733.1 putative amino-acid metabolite efflux pump [Priestia megaterium Q3]AWD66608.1 EamA/RhaT family transporter [Priestia megaterium]MCA1049233.1 DMT family transporter [Priestia aryabhattai]MDE8674736.1 DMT family transporter [Priestia aryabhattai]MDT0147763.1 DMT family transporter [Priestia aryabhattai]